MKILFVHNRYQHKGGEDSVLQAEFELLQKYGHDVTLAIKDNTDIQSFPDKLRVFINTPYSDSSKQWMAETIKNSSPDIVHVHNFFPLLTPSIYDACIKSNTPVVQTLHNYRTICPGALLLRNGNVCELCVTGSPYQAVKHGCYKESRIGTFAVARMVDYHRKVGTWKSKVNRFIALTEFSRNKFIEAGFPEHKIVVKPNFVAEELSDKKSTQKRTVQDKSIGSTALFVGRLSNEKGLSTLLNAWKGLNSKLKIAGTGPLEQSVRNIANNNINYLGGLDHKSVLAEMSKAAFLVMPSEWHETFGMVQIEAFSQGLPVIASRLGGMAEIVEDGVTGLHFEAGNAEDLAKKVSWLNGHPDECFEMGKNAREVFEQKYTAERNYQLLIDIYQQAIASNTTSVGSN